MYNIHCIKTVYVYEKYQNEFLDIFVLTTSHFDIFFEHENKSQNHELFGLFIGLNQLLC